jgi:chromosome partitioning protein
MNCQYLAVINQKGGVGKTTISANLGHALALAGQRVLLVDMDPQGHLAPCLGLFKPPQSGVDALLLEGASLETLVHKGRDGLALLPSGAGLQQVEEIQEGGAARAKLLEAALQQAALDTGLNWDWIIFDCPPMFGILMANVLMVAGTALVPVNADQLSLNGLDRLLGTVRRFESIRGTTLDVWVVMSRFQPRRRLAQEVHKQLEQRLPGRVLATPIKDSSALTECPGLGRTIFEYRQHSSAAQGFADLAQELMGRMAARSR